MSPERFDHVFVEPASFDASLAICRSVAFVCNGRMTIVLADPHPAADR
jgi:hypothetical protein